MVEENFGSLYVGEYKEHVSYSKVREESLKMALIIINRGCRYTSYPAFFQERRRGECEWRRVQAGKGKQMAGRHHALVCGSQPYLRTWLIILKSGKEKGMKAIFTTFLWLRNKSLHAQWIKTTPIYHLTASVGQKSRQSQARLSDQVSWLNQGVGSVPS